ncbi:MAG: hypothetical protein ACO1RT_10585 [Planctomycetaceae bacterium]
MASYNILFFLSGFAALVYEVSWNRQFGLLFGLTSHAAAIVLAAYFGGMAIGYAVGGQIANRVRPFRGYAACELVASLWAIRIPAGIGLAGSASLGPLLQADSPGCSNVVARLVQCFAARTGDDRPRSVLANDERDARSSISSEGFEQPSR